ncbi:hypothetical protein M5E87_19720 [Flavonifractor plautii]|nr:hypothetical protein M5E87_19720 [Flavonifractor plautii]
MILVLFLTVGGLALAVQSFGRYDTLLLEQSDSQLYGLARSVDRSVSGALEQFIGELDYLIRLENFTDAEADCLAGQPEELLQLLQNNPLIREALITDFLCLQDGRVLLSASGRTGYTFPVGGSLDGRDRVRPCVAENGTVYLSFQLEGSGAVVRRAGGPLSLLPAGGTASPPLPGSNPPSGRGRPGPAPPDRSGDTCGAGGGRSRRGAWPGLSAPVPEGGPGGSLLL